jgi:hypothetical protein
LRPATAPPACGTRGSSHEGYQQGRKKQIKVSVAARAFAAVGELKPENYCRSWHSGQIIAALSRNQKNSLGEPRMIAEAGENLSTNALGHEF